MNSETAQLLATLTDAAPENAAEVVMTAYRLGFIDGQTSMSNIAQSHLEFLLQGLDTRARKAGL